MLTAIREFFDKHIGAPGERANERHTIEIATAALLIEVLRVDGEIRPAEREAALGAMRSKFGLGADETAALLKKAKTDSERRITYEPDRRPEVSNLLLLASLCTGEPAAAIADRIADGGSGALKTLVTQALNDTLAPIRQRRELLARDPAVVLDTLRTGNERANEVADSTLREARAAMNMDYGLD